MAQRLDNRACLYGETRLSDAQVIALRELSRGPIYRDRTCYRTGEPGSSGIRPATIASLARILAAKVEPSGGGGVASITGTGTRLLAKIDAEAEAG